MCYSQLKDSYISYMCCCRRGKPGLQTRLLSSRAILLWDILRSCGYTAV